MDEMDRSTVIPDTPDDSPLTLTDVMTSPVYQELVTTDVSAGDPAVDFALPRLDEPGATVRLSQLAGTPVALIFGSYT